MNRTGTALMGMVLLTGAALAADEPAPEKIDAKLLKLHRDEARRWEIFVDATRTKKAEFVPEPVYRWTNASRANGQTGAMFVWTFEGRPVALGGSSQIRRRAVASSCTSFMPSGRFGSFRNSTIRASMAPGAGVPLYPLPDSPAPAATAKQRATRCGKWPENSPLIRLTMSERAGNCDCYPVRFIGTRTPGAT